MKYFTDRYDEPLRTEMQARSLFNQEDFAKLTSREVRLIPGITPLLFGELENELDKNGIHFKPDDLETLGLSVRCFNLLMRANIYSIDLLTKHSRNQLLQLRNVKEDDVAAIEAALQAKGLSLSATDYKRPAEPTNPSFCFHDLHCFVERYDEPLCSELKKRGLFNVEDFANISRSEVAAIPGMRPLLLKELAETLAYYKINFAE